MEKVFVSLPVLLFTIAMLTTAFTPNPRTANSEESGVFHSDVSTTVGEFPSVLPASMAGSLKAGVEFKIDVSFCEKGQLTLTVLTDDSGDTVGSKLLFRWFIDGKFASTDATVECICGRYALLYVINMVDFSYGYQYVLLPPCRVGR